VGGATYILTGYRVVEAPTPSAKRLRGTGKTDALDALAELDTPDGAA